MADDVRVTNFPESGSRERVAYDLANRVWGMEHLGKGPSPNARKEFLDLYAECLEASYGGRRV
jgi:hypothetical protein